MMKTYIYTVIDRVDDREFYPILALNDGELVQMFARCIEPNSVFWNSSDDFAVTCIGYIEAMEVFSTPPRFVATIAEILKPKKDYMASISIPCQESIPSQEEDVNDEND